MAAIFFSCCCPPSSSTKPSCWVLPCLWQVIVKGYGVPVLVIFLAIYAVALTIGCLSCFYLFGFVFWWHDYPRGGNFWGMMLGVPIFVSCAIGVALLIASWVADGAKVGVLLILALCHYLC